HGSRLLLFDPACQLQFRSGEGLSLRRPLTVYSRGLSPATIYRFLRDSNCGFGGILDLYLGDQPEQKRMLSVQKPGKCRRPTAISRLFVRISLASLKLNGTPAVKRAGVVIMNKKQDMKGFTLMEMAIVLATIAILAAILTPIITSYVDRARLNAARADVKNIAAALVQYNTDLKFYPVYKAGGAMPAPATGA